MARLRIKHEHYWKLQNTFCGGGTNGSVKVCECGARLELGVRTEAIQHMGHTFFREEGIKRYHSGKHALREQRL